jgi:hypothetical protein
MVRLLRTMAPFRVSKRTGVAEHRLRNTHVVYILQAKTGVLPQFQSGNSELAPSLRSQLSLHREDEKIIHPIALHKVIL